MANPWSVPLTERQADVRMLAEKMKEHVRNDTAWCSSSIVAGKCAEWKQMKAELDAIRYEIAHWFGPAPDAERLF